MSSSHIIILINDLNFAKLVIWPHQNSEEIANEERYPVLAVYFLTFFQSRQICLP